MGDYHLAYTAVMQENVRLQKQISELQREVVWLKDVRVQDADSYTLFKKRYEDKEAPLTEAGEMLGSLSEIMSDYPLSCKEYDELEPKLSALIQKIRRRDD